MPETPSAAMPPMALGDTKEPPVIVSLRALAAEGWLRPRSQLSRLVNWALYDFDHPPVSAPPAPPHQWDVDPDDSLESLSSSECFHYFGSA